MNKVFLSLISSLGLFLCVTSAQSADATATLQDAIKARTEVTVLQQEVLGLERDVLEIMRKVVAKAEGKLMEGGILLTKDHYGEAVTAFQEAARLYQQVADGKKLLEKLARADRAVSVARLLAEAAAKPEQLTAAKKLQINADGYLAAGELAAALAELEKARQAFDALTFTAGSAALEDAVAARTAMLAAREQIKNLPRFETGERDDELRALKRRFGLAERDAEATAKGPKPGTLTDLLARAGKAARAGADALEERQYSPARTLFAAAEKFYRDAGVLQGKREAIVASRQSVEDAMKLADKAFKSEARPASFERGKQALADADKALGEDDFDATKKALTQAAEQFAAARADADKMNALSDAQQAWAAALAAADEELLNKHVASQFAAVKAQAADAQAKASVALFSAATAALKDAGATAKTKENAAKAAPVIARLETAVASRDKFGAEDVLAELEALIPSDARMTALRERVAAMPGPKKNIAVDLGGGVAMEFILIRPGAFMMGSDLSGQSDEKPTHKVRITKPFYMGKFVVTQEQWEKVMGANPSNFKGAKHPVEMVSWDDCQSFLAKLKEKAPGTDCRLPTEAQWEYACRAGTTTAFSFGDSETALGDYAWFSGNSENKTHEVGKKKPNAWGLFDMHGNAWEWCADWKGDYSADEAVDPTGPSSGSCRVLRGGSWDVNATYCRSAARSSLDPTYRFNYDGLRLVVVPR